MALNGCQQIRDSLGELYLTEPLEQRKIPIANLCTDTHAQAMAGHENCKDLNRHPDFPRLWDSNPIECFSTEEVWAYGAI